MSEAAASPVASAPAPAAQPAAPIEKVVLAGGESPASWDELDALTSKQRAPKKEPKESKESKEAKSSNEKREKSQPKDEESNGDEETSDAKSKQANDKKSEQKKDSVESSEKPAKLVKVKSGEETLELSADAMIPVKVDGKTIEVPLQEAINRYSQQSHLDKLFKDFKSEKQTFDAEKQAVSTALNKSYEYLVEKKDLRGFIEFMGEAIGTDAQTLYQDAIEGVKKQVEEMMSLSPEERKLRQVEEENAYYKQRMDAQKSEKERAKSQQELEGQVRKVMESYGMKEADLVSSYEDLIKLGHDPSSITPEFLGSYFTNMQTITRIEASLQAINPELASNQEVVEQLATYAIQTKATAEEIEEAIKQIYDEQPEKKLSKKIQKTDKAMKSVASSKGRNPGSDPMFFDDM